MSNRWLPVITEKQKNLIFNSIRKDAEGNFSYYFLVALAAIVATFGLLQNSSTIIVGAMLISPIMKPIIGMSFSISTGDSKLFRRSIQSIIIGTLLAVTLSVFITLLVPTRALTNEMLTRSQPTIIDLIIALASGAAGAYILFSINDLTVLPGVAIATALMPPLCVVGAGLALNNFSVALGAFLLFLANLIAINLSAAIIFKFIGFTTKDDLSVKNEDGTFTTVKNKPHRLLLSISALVVISIPLTIFMYNTINMEKTDKAVDNALKNAISLYDNVDLVNYSYKLSENKYIISTVVRSDKQMIGTDIIEIENIMEQKLNKPTEITMKIIFTTDVDALTTPSTSENIISSDGNTSGQTESTNDNTESDNSDVNDSSNDTQSQTATVTTPDKFIQYTIEEKCKLIYANLIDFDFSYNSYSAIYTINAKISTTGKDVESIKDSIVTVLEDNLNRKVNLIIESSEETAPAETAVPDQAVVSDDIYGVTTP